MNNVLNEINKFILLAFVALNFSCSKDIVQSSSTVNSNGEISINTIGIENQQESVDFKSSSTNNSASPKYTIDEYKDVNLISTIIDNPAPSVESLKMKSSVNLNVEALSGDIKYVLYIYDGNTFITSKLFTVGISSSITGLDPTKKYKWSAVSYNSKKNAPPLEGDAALTIPQNTELLFANGEIDLKVTENISILFKRALSRIIIELNTIGVSGDLNCPDNSCFDISPWSGTKIQLYAGTLDVKTGAIQADADDKYYLPTFEFKNSDPNYHDRKQLVMYTAKNNSYTGIGVYLKNITVTDYDGLTKRTYFKDAGIIQGVKSYRIYNQFGKSKRLVLNLVHSHLTSSNGAEWARSNLYERQDIRTKIDEIKVELNEPQPEIVRLSLQKNIIELEKRLYAFPSSNTATSNSNSFFEITNEDPCAKLYPYKLWRLPTQAEIIEFTTNGNEEPLDFGNITSQPIGSTVSNYISYTPTIVPQTNIYENSTADNNILFHYNGYNDGQSYANKLAAYGLMKRYLQTVAISQSVILVNWVGLLVIN